MACRPRVVAPGLLYHVIAHVIAPGNQRQATFPFSEDDVPAYLTRLAAYRQKHGLLVWAYCLMPNHVHLLVETTEPPPAKFREGLQQCLDIKA